MTSPPITSAGASETRILLAPSKAGLTFLVEHSVDGGDFDLTVNPTSGTCYGYNQANSTAIAFETAGDWVMFVSVKIGAEYAWRLLEQEGTDATRTDVIATTVNATSATITNATLGKLSVTATAVTAAGSGIGNAGALAYGMNIVGSTDNTKGVILPVATANAIVEVLQTVNNKALAIYPQVNSAIGDLSDNAALNTGTSNTAADAGTTHNVWFKFIATNTTQWYISK